MGNRDRPGDSRAALHHVEDVLGRFDRVRRAIERAIRFALAIGANINRHSVFARKNYFYPDLPKGYQISQYELPIVQGGEISIVTKQGEKKIRLTRAHLVEDTGKSLHEDFHGMSGIDLNRAGTLDRHLRRQHAGGLVPLRRERLGAPPGCTAWHALRDQEPQLVPVPGT